MHTFFKKYKTSNRKSRTIITNQTKDFALKGIPEINGQLIKVNFEGVTPCESVVQRIFSQFIKPKPHCLFIVTSPTTQLHGEYKSFPFPGHNFTFISNSNGEISCVMSKRANTQAVLTQRKRAPDERFDATYSPTVRIYAPRFTTYAEEVTTWMKKAASCKDYSLYINVIPLNDRLNITNNTFHDNVRTIVSFNQPYVLHSSLHPTADHYIAANNCNSAIFEAIFGTSDTLIQDLYCQEAVTKIVGHFANNNREYQEIANTLGLTNGIKHSPLVADNYRAQFTC